MCDERCTCHKTQAGIFSASLCFHWTPEEGFHPPQPRRFATRVYDFPRRLLLQLCNSLLKYNGTSRWIFISSRRSSPEKYWNRWMRCCFEICIMWKLTWSRAHKCWNVIFTCVAWRGGNLLYRFIFSYFNFFTISILFNKFNRMSY